MLDIKSVLSALNGSRDGSDLVSLIADQKLNWHRPITELHDPIDSDLRDVARVIDLIDFSSSQLSTRLIPTWVYLRTGIKTRIDPETEYLTDTVTGEDYSHVKQNHESLRNHPVNISPVPLIIPEGTLDQITPTGVRFGMDDIFPCYDELYLMREVPDPYSKDAPSRAKLIHRIVGQAGEVDQMFQEEIIALLMGLATGVVIRTVDEYGKPGPKARHAMFLPETLNQIDAGLNTLFDDWDRILDQK